MTNQTYKVMFHIKGVDNELVAEAMKSELMRVYSIYANETNSGVTEALNNEFARLYPDYKWQEDWWDNVEYNQFMAEGYERYVVDKLNSINISPILKFYVDPKEVVFTGYLKWDRNATIDFYLEQV